MSSTGLYPNKPVYFTFNGIWKNEIYRFFSIKQFHYLNSKIEIVLNEYAIMKLHFVNGIFLSTKIQIKEKVETHGNAE